MIFLSSYTPTSNARTLVLVNLTANHHLFPPTFHRVSCHLLQEQRSTICNPHWASLKAHSAGNITHSSLCHLRPTSSHDRSSKSMKPPNSTTLRRDAEFMGPENIEKELKKTREELAWMRTEQKEIK